MALEDLVSILREYIENPQAMEDEENGPQMASILDDMKALLTERLEFESSYGTLWDAFQDNPANVEIELEGALEAVLEADTELARRLNGMMAEYNRLIAELDDEEREEAEQLDNILFPPEVVGENSSVVPPEDESDEGDFEQGTYLRGNIRTSDTMSEFWTDHNPGETDVHEQVEESVDLYGHIITGNEQAREEEDDLDDRLNAEAAAKDMDEDEQPVA